MSRDINYMLAVMQAFADGKKIECQSWKSADWREIKEPEWNWYTNDYRIAEEPKYREYKDTDEMINDFCHRFNAIKTKFGEPLIWVMDKKSLNKYLITFFGGNFIALSEYELGLNELFENYTYFDGSSIGKIKK